MNSIQENLDSRKQVFLKGTRVKHTEKAKTTSCDRKRTLQKARKNDRVKFHSRGDRVNQIYRKETRSESLASTQMKRRGYISSPAKVAIRNSEEIQAVQGYTVNFKPVWTMG